MYTLDAKINIKSFFFILNMFNSDIKMNTKTYEQRHLKNFEITIFSIKIVAEMKIKNARNKKTDIISQSY